MKVIIEEIGSDEEEQLILRCRELDGQLVQLINRVRNGNAKLNAQKEGRWYLLEPKEIYYAETVDNKVFLYTEKEMFETRLKLYELELELGITDFFRISKSVIVNLCKIKSLYPIFNGRMEAVLLNSERVIISRQYVGRLKDSLGL